MHNEEILKEDTCMIVVFYESIVLHTTKVKAGTFFNRIKEENASHNYSNGDNMSSLRAFLKVKGKNKE